MSRYRSPEDRRQERSSLRDGYESGIPAHQLVETHCLSYSEYRAFLENLEPSSMLKRRAVLGDCPDLRIVELTHEAELLESGNLAGNFR